jgi:hypothetical protein
VVIVKDFIMLPLRSCWGSFCVVMPFIRHRPPRGWGRLQPGSGSDAFQQRGYFGDEPSSALAGQSVLVCADNNDITGTPSLQNNKRLCSVTGSTPAQRIDVVTTDETIGAGYAAQVLGVFNIVERYG